MCYRTKAIFYFILFDFFCKSPTREWESLKVQKSCLCGWKFKQSSMLVVVFWPYEGKIGKVLLFFTVIYGVSRLHQLTNADATLPQSADRGQCAAHLHNWFSTCALSCLYPSNRWGKQSRYGQGHLKTTTKKKKKTIFKWKFQYFSCGLNIWQCKQAIWKITAEREREQFVPRFLIMIVGRGARMCGIQRRQRGDGACLHNWRLSDVRRDLRVTTAPFWAGIYVCVRSG